MSAAAPFMAWFSARSARERALVAAAGALAAVILAASAALAVWEDFGTLRARVAARARELQEVQRLATAVRHAPVAAVASPDTPSLMATLETVAGGIVGRDRIAGMTPGTASAEDGLVEERVALRLPDASLAEIVRLLYVLETADPARGVSRLELRKHPDDPARFAATIEVASLRGSQ